MRQGASPAETGDVAASDSGSSAVGDKPAVTREDYVAAHGNDSTGIRQLGRRPAPETTARPNRRPRAKTTLPSVAAPPAYQPPEAREKTSEEDSVGTQKPDIRLTAETMQQSPLAAHLRKTTEQKRKGDEGETVAPAAPTGGRRRGSLKEERRLGGMGLEESRQRRTARRRKPAEDDGPERRGRGRPRPPAAPAPGRGSPQGRRRVQPRSGHPPHCSPGTWRSYGQAEQPGWAEAAPVRPGAAPQPTAGGSR